jgi:hypothetical protein
MPQGRASISLVLLAVAAFFGAKAAAAQRPGTPSTATEPSASQDSRDDLPVSLNHIREGLNRPAQDMLLSRAEIPADFRVQILEQQRIDELLKKLDFGKAGPIPAGGIYAYEQQRRLFDPVTYPLMQPYAAYSPGEFFVVALENLIGRYIAHKVATGADAHVDRAAQEEVDHAIADYCASRQDRWNITLCNR